MKSWRTAQKIKNTCHHSTYLYHYSVGASASHLHNRVSPHSPLVPSTLARARRAYPSQARLGYAGAKRSASHLVLIGFRLTFPLSQARTPWTRQARLRSSKACVRAHGRRLHTFIIGFRLTFPLSQARTPWTRQARLRSSKACVRAHGRSASHLHNRVQTSNKAHDKFVPRRDCACADHSRPSLSTALLSGWSSHLVLIGFRLTFPPIATKDYLDEASSPSVVQSLRTGS